MGNWFLSRLIWEKLLKKGLEIKPFKVNWSWKFKIRPEDLTFLPLTKTRPWLICCFTCKIEKLFQGDLILRQKLFFSRRLELEDRPRLDLNKICKLSKDKDFWRLVDFLSNKESDELELELCKLETLLIFPELKSEEPTESRKDWYFLVYKGLKCNKRNLIFKYYDF